MGFNLSCLLRIWRDNSNSQIFVKFCEISSDFWSYFGFIYVNIGFSVRFLFSILYVHEKDWFFTKLWVQLIETYRLDCLSAILQSSLVHFQARENTNLRHHSILCIQKIMLYFAANKSLKHTPLIFWSFIIRDNSWL